MTFRIAWFIAILINFVGLIINIIPPFVFVGFAINAVGLTYSIYKLFDTWNLKWS